MEKACIKCGCMKPLPDYYEHPDMADGHLNKCKECSKSEKAQLLRDRAERIRYKSELPQVICNASSRGIYRTGDGDFPVSIRPGSLVAHSLPSRGI